MHGSCSTERLPAIRPRLMPVVALLAGSVGALLGFAADRLATRWPDHETPAGTAPTRRLDWRTVVVMVAGLASLAGLFARWDEPRDVLVLAIYFAALIVLLATDLDQKLLPDLITFPLMAYALALLVLGWNPLLDGKSLGIISAVAAGIGAPVLLFISDRLLGGALGMGDLKLAVSLGLMSGVSGLFAGFLIASALSSVVLLVLIASRRIGLRSAIPFGPILIAAGIVAALLPA
ncbi:MAG: A24 family peptidase [Chloroflexota bacterium]|nr:A24 family peptidase [Chloroflexota bacterium]